MEKIKVLYSKILFNCEASKERLSEAKDKFDKKIKFVEYDGRSNISEFKMCFLDLNSAINAQNKKQQYMFLSEVVFDYCFQSHIFKNDFLNEDFYIIPAFKLKNVKKPFFCKPDKIIKSFSGINISNEYDIDTVMRLTSCTEFEKVIVAGRKEIESEFRFFISESEIVAKSGYDKSGGNKNEVPIEVEKFVERVIKPSGHLDEKIRLSNLGRYVIDVCKTKCGQIKVVELNCFHTSGIYNCNLYDIISKTTKIR